MNQRNLVKSVVSREEALECVRKLIQYIGDDPDREGLLDTPERVVRSYDELFSGYHLDPHQILQKTFPTASKEMVVLSNIEIYSTCEHHMIPFVGKCHIAYLPNDRVIGLSKLARMMEVFSRRLQIQEELTLEIAKTLNEHVHAFGVAVMIEAKHMCMSARGVNKQHSVMTTTAMLGRFQEDRELKNDFFRLVDKQSARMH
ncbi:MAG: GTP cyclohydrolase I FolE [SAR324 cluster bacterium]|uniref:GTP cyclohydrolase 1 n=1 Tax=SAR324 cluster bacterium TaxID=2024889 RepID=A0A2A4T6H0_9DELT|nr:MAG: GTP cyclohydrolase I FolE [SAR324 cluster bacterium]